jgi:hypothetical protein
MSQRFVRDFRNGLVILQIFYSERGIHERNRLPDRKVSFAERYLFSLLNEFFLSILNCKGVILNAN